MNTTTIRLSDLRHGGLPYWDEDMGDRAPELRDGYPPIIVSLDADGETYTLVDGYHRVGSAKCHGARTIEAVVATAEQLAKLDDTPSQEWIDEVLGA